MAAPTTEFNLSLDSLPISTLEERILRWSSSSSSSASRSTSTECPSLSKSSASSLSCDTQTETQTPPESSRDKLEDKALIIAGRRGRRPTLRTFFSHVPGYTDSDGCSTTDAGYETECETKCIDVPFGKLTTVRRARKGRRRVYRPARLARNGSQSQSSMTIPPAPNPNTFTGSPNQSPTSSMSPLLQDRPTRIELPPRLAPNFSASDAPIGLGLGFGLPSTLSAVRHLLTHRSSADAPPSTPARSIRAITPFELVSPFFLFPTQPHLEPARNLSPAPAKAKSPLDPDQVPCAPNPTTNCFSEGARTPALAAAAILTLANHAQDPTPNEEYPPPPLPVFTPEEDAALGIRRFESMNPYFPTSGYRVISG